MLTSSPAWLRSNSTLAAFVRRRPGSSTSRRRTRSGHGSGVRRPIRCWPLGTRSTNDRSQTSRRGLHWCLWAEWTWLIQLRQTDNMATSSVDTWGEVRRLRLEFADEIGALSPSAWDCESWCTGWRVRDVLGHLIQNAETNRLSMFWQILRNPFRPDRTVDRLARAVGDQPVPDLVERLRRAADGHFRIPGVPVEVGLGDLLIHGADALRPLGIVPEPPLADVIVALDTYKKWGQRVVHSAPHSRVSLTATDAEWHTGDGPEVRGRAIDLLLLMANRRQVVDQLAGPGVSELPY